jgi:hypothetical protein
VVAGAAALWLGSIAFGFAVLARHQWTAGTAATEASVLSPAPITAALDAAGALDGRSTIVAVAVHPRCPCTRVALAELARVLARTPDVACELFVLQPEDADDAWSAAAAEAAALLPFARIHACSEADFARFGTTTSGHVLVIDARGRLLYSGGATLGRGHAGDNPGLEAVRAALAGSSDPSVVASHPVFGCPLATPRPVSCCEADADAAIALEPESTP